SSWRARASAGVTSQRCRRTALCGSLTRGTLVAGAGRVKVRRGDSAARGNDGAPDGLFFCLPGRFRSYNPATTCPRALSGDLERLPQGERRMALTIERRTEGDIVVLDLKGRATIGSEADRLNEALRRELSGGTRQLLVNLTHLA